MVDYKKPHPVVLTRLPQVVQKLKYSSSKMKKNFKIWLISAKLHGSVEQTPRVVHTNT